MTASPSDESAPGRRADAAPAVRPLEVEVFTGPESAFFATSSLIMGERTAILVDAQLTRSAGRELAEWIAGKGRELLAIVVSHQHPDHYFGAEEVLRLFPAAQLLAAPSVVEGIGRTAAAKVAQWKPVYGDDVPDQPLLPAPLLPRPLMIDGQLIRVLQLGQGDSAGSTITHLPSIRTVVAGDFAYNGTHVWTADTDPDARDQWSHNLGRIADLGVDRVIAGHRAPGMDDAAHRVLAFTAGYLRDFDEALHDHPEDAEALAAAVNERYGGLTLPAILEHGAAANVARREVPHEDNGIVDAEIVDGDDQ
ncbi:glyoxylase-like metal-dependent hydrolase (beta-lactamase superfamily II) [Kitasatospora sp. SolWspMP-SS2h]|uniref:MBL fold metallo-hydrolase n=1 Tax=Kitasatospora sp. SolWspMP-SS2h TaxID=1305729 RepID=UPI000DBA866C|nr:MBL fold metallo-hydrolase [Kitasatospora sp. SolWspMP-SS2h]RAJ37656.1 glyoxylase-like metal-dependent hydrolase (beta-lactamase superfamily II) [Kitasatospora sp. SolWspMP-SS2h]